MPKRAARYAHVRELASSTTTATTVAVEKTKRHRSVHIGLRNSRRWLSLKKRLGLVTDDDLVVYLLDLADSIATRRDESCHDSCESWKIHCSQDKKMMCVTENSNSLHDTHQMELPRRSSRKLLTSEESVKKGKAEINEKFSTFPNNLENFPQSDSKLYSKSCARASKTKRHKTKNRHHKEKRKKRKHQKANDLEIPVNDQNNITNNTSWNFNSGSNVEKSSTDEKNFVTQENHSVDLNNDQESQNSYPEVNQKQHKISGKEELNNVTGIKDREKIVELPNQEVQNVETKNESNKPIKLLLSSSESSQSATINLAETLNTGNNVQDSDNLNHQKIFCSTQEQSHEHYCDHSVSSINKRDKKRQRERDQSKKHRDVRKAPHDGIINIDENQVFIGSSNNVVQLDNDVTSASKSNILESEEVIENVGVETPRLAIKIKLCQDCNNRHLQDTCPFIDPEYSIKDSLSLEQWIKKYHKNSEAMKAYSSNDPMCQGYKKHIDDGLESDEELSGQCKSKTKIESEEKREIIDANRPLYARDSLPECLEFKISNMSHGLGVFVKSLIPMYAQLGPLIGKPIQEMDIPDDYPMRHIWEININNKTLYISTTNPLSSNWIRYVRPAETKDERNVAVINKNGKLFLVTSKSLIAGTELTYWSESQSMAWARKNKIDKTNCGGCNLNFAHPIYYRLHCCIFHDTNYSLTIRKYHCKVCGVAVLGKDNIMKHAAELHAGRGAYQCQYCKKFFLRLNYLEMHRTYGCSQNPQRSRPLCDFCGRKFCQPQKLKVHIKRMHSDMAEVLREFQCKLCSKLLGSRAALQRHMKEVHHKDVGAATCDRCGKMFQNKSNLKIHMLTHSGVKPFKCKENGCKAAFTTKQCLQFHYKKVHGLSEEMMPKIERSVAYTFDAYSGGLVEDVGRGKTPKFNATIAQENSDSATSIDDCSSENNNSLSVSELPCISSNLNDQIKSSEEPGQDIPEAVIAVDSPVASTESDIDPYSSPQIINKSTKKWINEFDSTSDTAPIVSTATIYDFHNRGGEEKIRSSGQSMCDDAKLGVGICRPTESANASLLVEAALDAAEREIGVVSSPILGDSDREANLYSISNELDFKNACSQNQTLHRSPNGHLDNYISDELVVTTASTPHSRHTPPGHIHPDYHIHRHSVDYINTTNRTHNIEHYLDQQEVSRAIHVSQDTPAACPLRYQEMPHSQEQSQQHHQAINDVLSSDEGDSVAQNLSLPIKEKTLHQLELNKYDGLEAEFSSTVRERLRFEPLIVQSAGDQGLDMSARGFQQAFGSPVQNNNHHHHHHNHHLFDISERERQGVDLSRTAACVSPPAYPLSYPPYSHVDVPRVVSLESSTRSHHLHTSVSRIITSPQPASSLTSHLMSDSFETRLLSSPPPSIPAYNAAYSVGPAPYHSSRSSYHYSSYY